MTVNATATNPAICVKHVTHVRAAALTQIDAVFGCEGLDTRAR
jgi:hypothetical protein